MVRMSKGTWDKMRNRGGAHGTKKGNRGYSRPFEKQKIRNTINKGGGLYSPLFSVKWLICA